ncbi:MAG: hypothetical protein LBL15_07205 [Oscillospiraceae bacterium]|jgi:hypothetical protein|nr:hypothetical protein [Oscillospiraceae bacterium]
MLFFWWKKYEGSWIATAVSFFGTLLITVGSLVLIGLLAAQLPGYIENKTLSNVVAVVGVIIGIGVFIALKILLNKLTDKIANRV